MPATSVPRSSRRLGVAFVLVLVALVAGLAFAQNERKEDAKPALKRVEAKKVCMVNNQVFEKDQIPVEVKGRMYYGCCEMCKQRLALDKSSREAVDPVTGKTVDKATAVIGALEDGSVLYFENEETLAKYVPPAAE